MGSQDIPLNDHGTEQAKKAAQLLKHESFSAIAASPLSRAKVTAEIIGAEKGISTTLIHDLKECSWGAMDGQLKGDGSWLDDWRKDKCIEGAELFFDFSKRILSGLNKALELPGTVLIVAHGGVYWPIQKALNLPITDLKNCAPVYHRAPPSHNIPWFVYPLGDDTIRSDAP